MKKTFIEVGKWYVMWNHCGENHVGHISEITEEELVMDICYKLKNEEQASAIISVAGTLQERVIPHIGTIMKMEPVCIMLKNSFKMLMPCWSTRDGTFRLPID